MGNMWPIVDKPPGNKTTYPWGRNFEVDQSSIEDSALAAAMLAGAVNNSNKGVAARCNYDCDTEFGCDHCIPKGIVATMVWRQNCNTDLPVGKPCR